MTDPKGINSLSLSALNLCKFVLIIRSPNLPIDISNYNYPLKMYSTKTMMVPLGKYLFQSRVQNKSITAR